MKFARIEMLFLIWVIPVLFLVCLYGMKKRGKILSHFSSAKGLKSVVQGASSGRRWLKAGLMLSALFFIALALTRPQYGYKWQEIERKGIDIIIALDCSRSMLAEDIRPTRLDRAKREVYDLLTMLRGDRAGLVAFAGTAFLQCPLTLDYDAFNLFLKALSPDFLPVGGTDITGAVTTAIAGFDEKTNSEKAVILITDGENTGEGDPLKAAENARNANIKLFCIGVGSEGGVPVPAKQGGFQKDKSGKIILTKLDEDTLKKMAVLTRGTYVRSVAGDMDLDAIYTKEIRGKMKSATLESGRKQIWEERYQWFLGLAILALIAELFLPSAKKTASVLGVLFLLVLNPAAHAGPMQDGLEAYEKGDYEKALKLFIDAQLEDPDNPRILYNVGNAYYKVGDFESANKNFEQALKAEDKTLRQKALYNLGNSNYKRGKFEDAIKNYEEVLKSDPNDEQTQQNIEFVRQVIAQKKEQEKQQQGGDNKEGDSEKKESDVQKNESDKNESGKKEDGSEDAQSDKKDSDGNDSQKDEPAPKYGDEMDDKQNEASEQKAGSPDEENKEDEKKTGVAQASPSENSEGPDDKMDDKNRRNGCSIG